MLIKCPECELQVSDKALSCPHCGYPLKKSQQRISSRKKRLPNGFGQITELKNKNLRAPYRAMVSIGKNENGRPICRLLKPQAYFKTYNEAYAALVEYNKNPYQFDKEMTLSDLFEKWFQTYKASGKSDSAVKIIKAAWNYCSPIKDMVVQEVKPFHVKGLLESENIRDTMVVRVQHLLTTLFDYAMQYELVDKNVAKIAKPTAKKHTTKSHTSFTDDEMTLLWNNSNDQIVRMILIQCYTGFRPSELLNIRVDKVDLDNLTITEGMKTEAGKDRIVPIHPRILPLIEEEYNRSVQSESGTLFFIESKGSIKPIAYSNYVIWFAKVCSSIGLNNEHRPHDPRKQFVTMAKKYNVDEYAIKRIVGHAIKDLTERVYTDRGIDWLSEEIKKIP